MKYYSKERCPKCDNQYLIVGNKLICPYCETEVTIDESEQTINQRKSKKPY